MLDFWIIKLGSGMLGTNENHFYSNLSISPNPNQGKFKLQLNNLQAFVANVTITDVLGRIILSQQLPVINQQLSTEMEIGAAKGLYVVQIQAGSQLLTRKIIVE